MEISRGSIALSSKRDSRRNRACDRHRSLQRQDTERRTCRFHEKFSGPFLLPRAKRDRFSRQPKNSPLPINRQSFQRVMHADRRDGHRQFVRRRSCPLRTVAIVRPRAASAAPTRRREGERPPQATTRPSESTALPLLVFQPEGNGTHNVGLFRACERAPLRNVVPLLETSATACCCRMLRDENRMSLERSLLPVVDGKRRGEAALDKVTGMLHNSGHALAR